MTITKELVHYKIDNNTKNVIKYFEQISKVPRSSGKETLEIALQLSSLLVPIKKILQTYLAN